jgi:hypothetical protein
MLFMTHFGVPSTASYVSTGFVLAVDCSLGRACSSTLVQPCDGVTIHSEGSVRPRFALNCSAGNYVSLVVRDGIFLGSMQ